MNLVGIRCCRRHLGRLNGVLETFPKAPLIAISDTTLPYSSDR